VTSSTPFRGLRKNHSLKIARDLIATVSFHDRNVEAKTGGDLGIVLVRPDVRLIWPKLDSNHDYKRGLLCQAKMFQRNSRWGRLSQKQKQVLPDKLSYFALLLYRYDDQHGERRELAPFAWQLARDATVEQISHWLASDCFPELHDSQQILGALLRDQIGTDDKKLIENDIAPPLLRRSLVITIQWKDGRPPGMVHISERSTDLKQQAMVRQ